MDTKSTKLSLLLNQNLLAVMMGYEQQWCAPVISVFLAIPIKSYDLLVCGSTGKTNLEKFIYFRKGYCEQFSLNENLNILLRN